MTPAILALERLKAGNRRFASGEISDHHHPPADLTGAQAPMAVILGCSDSRVPPEILFDREPGDLFVVRVVGNVASSPQIGSIEYATAMLGSRLVVVLGHQECGAVEATLARLRAPIPDKSPHLQAIVETIRPAMTGLPACATPNVPEDLLEHAIRANVAMQTERLREGSSVLRRLEIEEQLLIVGAVYCLRSGEVEFLDSA